MLVGEDGDRGTEGHALTRADSAGGISELHDSVGCGDGIHKVVLAGGVCLSCANAESVMAGTAVEAGDSEEVGDVGGNSVGPPAVMVDELQKTGGFRLELVVGGVGGGGVVLALERVSKDDHEFESGISEDGEVEVTTRELVDLIDDENFGLLEKTRFPGGESEGMVWGKVQIFLPLISEFCRGTGNAE